MAISALDVYGFLLFCILFVSVIQTLVPPSLSSQTSCCCPQREIWYLHCDAILVNKHGAPNVVSAYLQTHAPALRDSL